MELETFHPLTLYEKGPHWEFFWSIFFRMQTEQGIYSANLRIYSVNFRIQPECGKIRTRMLQIGTLYKLCQPNVQNTNQNTNFSDKLDECIYFSIAI